MLGADVHLLKHETVSYFLVQVYANRAGRYVEHTAGFAMVALVRHTTLNRWVCLNVHDITKAVNLQVPRQIRHTLGLEGLCIQLARPCALTCRLLVAIRTHVLSGRGAAPAPGPRRQPGGVRLKIGISYPNSHLTAYSEN